MVECVPKGKVYGEPKQTKQHRWDHAGAGVTSVVSVISTLLKGRETLVRPLIKPRVLYFQFVLPVNQSIYCGHKAILACRNVLDVVAQILDGVGYNCLQLSLKGVEVSLCGRRVRIALFLLVSLRRQA